MADKRVFQGLCASTEGDCQNVVQIGTAGERLRVDRKSASISTDVKLLNHLNNFALQTGDIARHCLGGKESSRKTAVLTPIGTSVAVADP